MKSSEKIYKTLDGLFNSCIYPLVRPESERTNPFMVYRILNTNPENFVGGYSGEELAYIQIDVYTEDYDSCEAFTTRTIDILNEQAKPFFYEGRKYLYEDDTKLFRQSIECYLFQNNWKTILNYAGSNFIKAGDDELIGKPTVRVPE